MRAMWNLGLVLIAGVLSVAILTPLPALGQAAERSTASLPNGQRKSKIS